MTKRRTDKLDDLEFEVCQGCDSTADIVAMSSVANKLSNQAPRQLNHHTAPYYRSARRERWRAILLVKLASLCQFATNQR